MTARKHFNFNNCRFLCVGEVMLDHFVYGNVGRISPEAPVPVLHAKRDFYTLGGAGNVIRNMLSLGASGDFLCVLGDDADSLQIQEMVSEEEKVELTASYEKGRRLPRKSRFIAQGQQILRIDYEDLHPIKKKTENDFIKIVNEKLSNGHTYDVVIISDYNKGVLSSAVCKTIIEKSNVPVIVDPKGRDFSKYAGAYLMTPNLKELKETTDFDIQSEQDIIKAAEQIREKLSLSALLLTRGAEGMTLFTKDENFTIKASAKEVFDVSGAGDTVVATAAVCLSQGISLKETAAITNAAGAIVVGKVGTATVDIDELNEALSGGNNSEIEDVVVSVTQAREQSEFWQRQGLRVGFTNGCFDLLHQGHLHSLSQAAQNCDKLVVAVNSDTSVKKLKGSSRPIQDQKTRAQVLASLKMVDLVVIFDGDTPITVIKKVMPNILFKGKDYTIENVVGADIVLAQGGVVKLLDLLPGHSTTATTERL